MSLSCRNISITFLFIFLLLTEGIPAQSNSYSWLANIDSSITIIHSINTPPGFSREPATKGSFQEWLRHLPLKPGHPPVHLFDGSLKINQTAHYAVLDIDTGSRDLQQCADAVIRLRAEYLYSKRQFRQIHFNFTSGDNASFEKWLKGYRPIINGNKVRWQLSAKPDSSYGVFRAYLETVFQFAGTYSLKRELEKVTNAGEIQIGDIFIKGGFPGHGNPGHAIIVVDIAFNRSTNQTVFLLAQSFMPAQEIHILKNPTDSSLSPWYLLDNTKPLQTPEWTFDLADLMRFK